MIDRRNCQLSLWGNAENVAIQVGYQFKRWYSGQITAQQFWNLAGDSIIITGATVAGGAGGVAAGAAIGMVLGPVGGILGAILGGIIGALSGRKVAKEITTIVRDYKEGKEANELVVEALNYYDLPTAYTMEMLKKANLTKMAQFHPDKWLSESQERQIRVAAKYQKTLIYYEILKAKLGVQQREP